MDEKDILSTLNNGVRKIVLNRPDRKNAFNKSMYIELTNMLNEDAKNDNVVVTIITGTGDFYSSGNDFGAIMRSQDDSSDPVEHVKHFVQAFIDYPKLLIAVVNGPAIGIAATSAALCDIIYCSDRAYFHTPFVNLGVCAEGTSSFTFPGILGRSKASETIFLGRKLSAKEAYEFGLVSSIIPHQQVEDFIKSLYKYGELPVNTLKLNKSLIMRNLRDILTECNKKESEALLLSLQSEEFTSSMIKLLSKRKSKL